MNNATKILPSPIRWVGAKNRMRSKIAPILEEARRGRPVYVEPFGGSAAMLLALEPVKIEIYNDADGRLADFFRALADDKAFEKMKRYAAAFPQSREIYDEMKRVWVKSPELAKRGFATFYIQSFSFGGRAFDSFGVEKKTQGRRETLGRIAQKVIGLTNTRRGLGLRASSRTTGGNASLNTIPTKRFFTSIRPIAKNNIIFTAATCRRSTTPRSLKRFCRCAAEPR